MEDQKLHLEVASKLENLPEVRDFIADAMKSLGFGSEKEIFEVQVAVDEACTNIMKHAYPGTAGPIIIDCSGSGNEFKIIIRDKGKSFDPKSVPEPDTKAPLEKRKIGGLGIFLMKAYIDKLDYTFDADAGNELTMIKYIGK
ncbi:MAG: ATP-binding protein [Thermoplasmata archaeon]|nr:MAG: ATP-binding protein [Thermoplasmata archaeon]